MANAREIQSRIKSIQDTMKITNAMYMISSVKLRRAKKSLCDTEPYFYSIQATISRIIRHVPDMKNKYINVRLEGNLEEDKIGYVVITADKGLAGAYNHNVLKLAHESMEKSKNNKLFVLGMIGRQYFSRKGTEIEENFEYTVQKPSMHRARMITERLLSLYDAGELDQIQVIFTRMKNGTITEAEKYQLLPLQKQKFENVPVGVPVEVISFSPSLEEVMNNITPNYVAGFLYGAMVESYCCEQSQRMTAMQAATESAQKMLHDLAISYNRVRQAAITQGITEVVGGAKAQKKKKNG